MSTSPILQVINEIIKQQSDAGITLNKHHVERKIAGRVEKPNYFYLFSYREDFNALWDYDTDFKGIQDIIASDSGLYYRTIIVWDGYPDSSRSVGAVSIQNWVTPVDWAVCAALAAKKNTGKLPNWGVLIIDLVSQNYAGSQSLRLLQTNPALLPWVRIYRPAIDARLLHNDVRELLKGEPEEFAAFRSSLKDDFTTLVEDLQIPKNIMGLNSCAEALDDIGELWSSNLVRPGDRHRVANLIAPIILFSSIKNWQDTAKTITIEQEILTSDAFALSQELGILDLIELPTGGSYKANLIREVQSELSSVQNCEILLIDDQYSIGYESILKYIIGNNASLSCADNADILFEKINSRLVKLSPQIITPGWQGPLYDNPTILMLDLRLWTGIEQLPDFYKKLSTVMEMYIKTIKVVKDEIRKALDLNWQQVRESIANNPKEENLLALTILPRLLSILDPFLPIILFTSSSNRETIEAMTAHANIIPYFKKPMPTGYKSKLKPSDYLDALKNSFKRAVDICEMRSVGNNISKLEKKCFIDNKNIIFSGFKNSADGAFDKNNVCLDIRQTSAVLIRGEYNLAVMLPIMLLEYWYNKLAGKRFHDEKPMTGHTFRIIRDARNDIAHGTDAYFLDDSSPDIRNKAIDTWQLFFSLIK